MLNRRQLLLSAAVLGTPVAMALPLPEERCSSLRLGLLQSQWPFVDTNDIAGSRERAFTAYRGLLQRSLEQHGPLDWLVGGAFPLSGAGPFPEPVVEGLALCPQATEVESLSALAKSHQLRLTFGAWWRETGNHVTYRMLSFDKGGYCRALKPNEYVATEKIQLQLPANPTPKSLAALAADCRRLGRYGGWVEMLQGPAGPPGAPPVTLPSSAVIGPTGETIATTNSQTESCLIAELG